ncbi:MAG: hypothetical protein GXO80_10230 [Chlorobi bacterium]|nr:hypothetical protein [Chlorobiota bacterium]
MKHLFSNLLLIVFFVSVFSSCYVYPHLEHSEYTYAVDLNKYSNEDFLFTSEGYNGKYKSCGFVKAELFPEVKYLLRTETFDETKYQREGNFIIEKISIDEIINNFYKKAININANAVIRLKIVKKRNPKLKQYPQYESKLNDVSEGYFISGFAIKRID